MTFFKSLTTQLEAYIDGYLAYILPSLTETSSGKLVPAFMLAYTKDLSAYSTEWQSSTQSTLVYYILYLGEELSEEELDSD